MLEAMMTIGVNNLCKVVMDGIYFKGKTPSTLDWFVEKEMKQHGYTLNYWYDGSNVNVDWDTCKYENNVFLGGQGGAGKSYSILTDKCYNNILYVCPQHTLGQKQRNLYNVNYTTVHQLLGIGTQAYNQIRGIPPVIFWDEITQCPAEWVEKGLKMYNQSLIILAGDIDKDGMYYQTRMEVGDMYKPTIDYAFIDGDRRSRDDELKDLKLRIRERMRKVFIDGKSGEEVLMTQWALKHLNVMSLEQAVHQFCVGDTWIAGTHKTNARLLEAGVASGWYKKGGWISDVEKEGYEKRGSFTIHSYQGSTIETGKVFISIHDMFDFTMLYTAVSRAVHFNQLIFVA
jgi:hypothetical protein